jgi:hypothetical protein
MTVARASIANLRNQASNQFENLPAGLPKRKHRATKAQLIDRRDLDGRSQAAKAFDQIVRAIEVDLGGHERLSTIQRALIEAFASATLTMNALNVRMALGQEIDPNAHAVAVSAMVRVASKNPYVERLIGSIRRECLDHVIIFNEHHLRRVLSSYFQYHHEARTHLSLGKDCPRSRPVQLPSAGNIIPFFRASRHLAL